MHFKPSARQVLQALKEGMCEVRPLTMQFAHTDFIAKQSLQLLRHGDLLDISLDQGTKLGAFSVAGVKKRTFFIAEIKVQ